MNPNSSIRIKPETRKRFNSLKALADENADKFLNLLLDDYEETNK